MFPQIARFTDLGLLLLRQMEDFRSSFALHARGRPGLWLHQPKDSLSVLVAHIRLCEDSGQYHRPIDSSPSFWLNHNCP
jgi:hypothetical protein